MKYKGWYSYNDEKHDFIFDVKDYSPSHVTGEGVDGGGPFSIDIKVQTSLFCTMKKIYHGSHTVFTFNY